MKKLIRTFLILALVNLSYAYGEDTVQDSAENTEKLWRTGSGAHDGSYTAISTSMIAWGIGLAVGIAVLVAVLHQSKASSGGGGGNNGHCHN
jgi:hypothetical protein